MRDPVIAVQLLNDGLEELGENMVCFRLIKELPLVQFLTIEILIDWDLHSVVAEPNDPPEEVGEAEDAHEDHEDLRYLPQLGRHIIQINQYM